MHMYFMSLSDRAEGLKLINFVVFLIFELAT